MNAPTEAVAAVTAAQQRASTPDSSAWVSANAGSGKTHVLVNRVIRLLLEGADPAKLLCITFTRAAAAEMANRLFEKLAGWAFADDETLTKAIGEIAGVAPDRETLAKARPLFARALETPGGLKIQTIHAFCEAILQRFPLEAGIVTGFEVLDERSAADLLADVRAEVLGAAGASGDAAVLDALQVINAHVQEDGFEKLVRSLIADRGKLKEALGDEEMNLEKLGPRIASALGIEAGLGEGDVIAEIAAFDAATIVQLRAWAAIAARGGTQDKERAEAIARILAADAPEQRYRDYLSLFMTGRLFQTSRAPRSERFVSAAVQDKAPDLAGWLLAEKDRVARAYERLKAAKVLEATSALMVIAEQIVSRYEARKLSRAALDYDDLIAHTLSLLRRWEMAWVLYKLDGGIDHILIDEAQDTSPEQWEIVRHLADEFFAGEGAREGPRTVFAVGDEKQSIYSFQGAEPRRFAEMRAHFGAQVKAAEMQFAPVDLTMSWRSTPAVLDAVDRVFAAARAARGLAAGAEPLRHEAERADQPGRVEIWPATAPDDEPERDHWAAPLDYESPQSPDVRLAERIAEKIKSWRDNETVLRPRARPIRPGDILILVRRRNRFVDAMIRALKVRDIPVAGADRMVLTRQIAVMDLIALGRFTLMPEDDLNLAALLKSPLVGLGEEALYEIAHGRPGSLWRALAGRRDEPFASAVSKLKQWQDQADFAPPYEFYARILDVAAPGEISGRKAMRARLGPEADDPINEFLALALQYEAHGTPSLTGFLDWVVSGEAEVRRDMDHGRDEVRIMTVHGAKGLEANIVFLPDTCQKPKGNNDPPLMMLEAPDGLGGRGADAPVWAIGKGYDTAAVTAARAELEERRDDEYRRLLYVAMTRARDWLIVAGYETKKGRAEGCWYDLVHEALHERAGAITDANGETVAWRIEGEAEAVAREEEVAGATGGGGEAPDWLDEPLAPEARLAGFQAPSRLGAGGEDEEPAFAEPATNSPLDAGAERRFRRGRLIHTLLQWLPDVEPGERRARAEAFLAQPGHGLEEGAAEPIADEVIAILEDDRFAKLFSADAMAEVPVAGTLSLGNGQAPVQVMGQIDRLVVTPDEVLIVDYKTNRPPPLKVEDVPAVYLTQMAAYAGILRSVFGGRKIACALLWTDGPRIMTLPAELLEAALSLDRKGRDT